MLTNLNALQLPSGAKLTNARAGDLEDARSKIIIRGLHLTVRVR